MGGPTVVTVCVDYADLLAITLPYMLRLGGDVIVVSVARDTETVGLVKHTNARLHLTEAFYECEGLAAKFNKASALNEVVSRISGWVLLLDADVIVPDAVGVSDLSSEILYGRERKNIETREEYEAFLAGRRDFSLIGDRKSRNGLYYRKWENPAGLAGYFQLFYSSIELGLSKQPNSRSPWTILRHMPSA